MTDKRVFDTRGAVFTEEAFDEAVALVRGDYDRTTTLPSTATRGQIMRVSKGYRVVDPSGLWMKLEDERYIFDPTPRQMERLQPKKKKEPKLESAKWFCDELRKI